MPSLKSYTLPLSYGSAGGTEPSEAENASASLLWVDRPFAVTAAGQFTEFLRRQEQDARGRIWLGTMELTDAPSRILCLSERHNLVTLRVEPDELDALGPEASFYNPLRWPPEPVRPGEEITILGYPRDQWPASLRYTFQVESVNERRFSAVLRETEMPGRLAGLCGAPVFRRARQPELVGVVVESLFHNEVVRAQHARFVDQCGILPTDSPA